MSHATSFQRQVCIQPTTIAVNQSDRLALNLTMLVPCMHIQHSRNVRPMPDTRPSRARNFVTQQSYLSDIASCPTFDELSN